jgi:hypothetical protein
MTARQHIHFPRTKFQAFKALDPAARPIFFSFVV